MRSMSQVGNDLYTGKTSLPFVGRRKLWFLIAAILVIGAALVPVFRPIQFSIEFTGGSQFTVSGVSTPDQAVATDAVLALTDRRLVVASPNRLALAVPIDGLRRIQFDIERQRPATLVIVPELARHEAQVLSIPPEHYRDAAEALIAIGHALAPPGDEDDPPA